MLIASIYVMAGDGSSRALAALLATTGFALAATAVVAVVASRNNRRSIRRLTRAARRLARGYLNPPVPTGRSHEFRRLGRALRAMVAIQRRRTADYAGERDKLSKALATMSDGVLLIDHAGNIELANDAAYDFLPLPPKSHENARVIDAIPDHELLALIDRCRESGTTENAELTLARNRRHLNVFASPILIREEQSVLLVLHDLTTQRRLDTTRREFVANVSHELRTPLASIKASAETLSGGAIDDPQASTQFLRLINQNVDKMELLVRDLLDLSRLESGEASLNLQKLPIGAAIAETLETHQFAARHANVSLEADDIPADAIGVADAQRLRQALDNLVENGIKFTEDGGSVRLSARRDGGWLEVEVRDSGVGIEAEQLPHVFERFYQADRRNGRGGSGLGLAIAKHIVQLHGGRIWVESAVGQGSAFRFTIPSV